MLKVNKKYFGIIYIILSAFFFSWMNFFVALSGDVPVFQKSFFRNLVATFFSLAMLLKNKEAWKTGKGHFWDLFARAFAGTIGVFGNFYALTYIPVADASILNKLSPFFAIIFSFFLLKEKPKKMEWAAVSIAFVGMLFIVKPGFNLQLIPYLAGVGGGFCAGLAYAFVRKMGKDGVNGNLIIFFFSAFSCLVTAPYLIFDYHPMGIWSLVCLLAAGGAATGGQVFITKAYACAPAKEISVYDYSIVIFAAVWDFAFRGVVPDWLSWVGYAVIIFAALGNWYFNFYRAKNKKSGAVIPKAFL